MATIENQDEHSACLNGFRSLIELYLNLFHLHWRIAAGTALGFILFTGLNQLLFQAFEHTRGIDWIYLPAGVRLLCTLLFGLTGTLGLFLGSLITSFFYYFPDDPARALAGSLVSALAPYLAYELAQNTMRLRPSLSNLTAHKLLVCALLYAACNALMHLLWFLIAQDMGPHPAHSTLIMFTGDLLGSLLVVYLFKHLLSIARHYRRLRRRGHSSPSRRQD